MCPEAMGCVCIVHTLSGRYTSVLYSAHYQPQACVLLTRLNFTAALRADNRPPNTIYKTESDKTGVGWKSLECFSVISQQGPSNAAGSNLQQRKAQQLSQGATTMCFTLTANAFSNTSCSESFSYLESHLCSSHRAIQKSGGEKCDTVLVFFFWDWFLRSCQ